MSRKINQDKFSDQKNFINTPSYLSFQVLTFDKEKKEMTFPGILMQVERKKGSQLLRYENSSAL